MEKLLANEIREHLKTYIGHAHYLSEFTFYGNGTIADLLDISDDGIVGYEIKSNSDTYARLPKQIEGYNSVCRKVYMVVGDKKRVSVLKQVPNFYGIIIARRTENNEVSFEEIREASPNPYWTHKALLMWLPSDRLKKYAKILPTLLSEYGGRKTPIGKLNKDTLIAKILEHSSDNSIEELICEYLKSNELSERRKAMSSLNQLIKNKDAEHYAREQSYRLNNWPYFNEDYMALLKPQRFSQRYTRLDSLGRCYLPLALEYNAKGIHYGKFTYNESTEQIDFLLKRDQSFLDSFIVPNCKYNLAFMKILKDGLRDNYSLAKLRNLIIEISENA